MARMMNEKSDVFVLLNPMFNSFLWSNTLKAYDFDKIMFTRLKFIEQLKHIILMISRKLNLRLDNKI